MRGHRSFAVVRDGVSRSWPVSKRAYAGHPLRFAVSCDGVIARHYPGMRFDGRERPYAVGNTEMHHVPNTKRAQNHRRDQRLCKAIGSPRSALGDLFDQTPDAPRSPTGSRLYLAGCVILSVAPQDRRIGPKRHGHHRRPGETQPHENEGHREELTHADHARRPRLMMAMALSLKRVTPKTLGDHCTVGEAQGRGRGADGEMVLPERGTSNLTEFARATARPHMPRSEAKRSASRTL